MSALGGEFHRHPLTQALLRSERARLAKTYEVDAHEHIEKLKQIASADLRNLFDAQGNVLPPHLWPDDIAVAVERFEVVESHPVERCSVCGGQRLIGSCAPSREPNTAP